MTGMLAWKGPVHTVKFHMDHAYSPRQNLSEFRLESMSIIFHGNLRCRLYADFSHTDL